MTDPNTQLAAALTAAGLTYRTTLYVPIPDEPGVDVAVGGEPSADGSEIWWSACRTDSDSLIYEGFDLAACVVAVARATRANQ